MTQEYREWRRKKRAFEACGHADWVRCKFCKKWGPPESMWVGIGHQKYQDPTAKHRECFAKYTREQRKLPHTGERERARDRKRGPGRLNRKASLARYNVSKKRRLGAQRYYRTEKGRLNFEKHATLYRARKFEAEGSHTPEEWRVLVKACGSRCARCGEVRKVTRDHIVPLSKGGTDYISNIQPLCRPCNSRKGNRAETSDELNHAGNTKK